MTETHARRTKANSADGAGPAFAFPQPAPSLAALNAQTAHALLAGFDIMEANMNAFRSFLDTTRTAVRRQQDAVFQAMRAQIAGAADGAAANGAEAASPFPGFGAYFAPFLAATKTYEQIGAAMLDAQRQAVDAISSQTQAR